mgnify:CR=1 FL=1
MRVLILTNMYPNPASAHSGIWLHEIVKGLQKKGYQFRVAFSVPAPPFPFSNFRKWNEFSQLFPANHEVDGVQIDFLRYYSSYKLIPHRHQGTVFMLNQRKNLSSIIEDFKPDLLWAQPSLPNGWAAKKLGKKLCIPYVVAVHGADINESATLPGAARKLRLVYETAKSVISISQRLDREVKNIAPASNRQLVHFGVDLSTFDEAVKIRHHYLSNAHLKKPLRILSVSNLIESKGIQYNIQAISKLVRKGLSIEYTIVGDGVFGNELKDMTVRLGLIEYIKFVGRLSHPLALEEMAKTDIFSLPSYQEGMGMVYLEAMALGVPAIGISGQGIEDVIENGKNGVLIDPHDPDSIVDTIEQLADDSELKKLIGSNAKLHIQQNFAWETTCEKFENIFRNTITT